MTIYSLASNLTIQLRMRRVALTAPETEESIRDKLDGGEAVITLPQNCHTTIGILIAYYKGCKREKPIVRNLVLPYRACLETAIQQFEREYGECDEENVEAIEERTREAISLLDQC